MAAFGASLTLPGIAGIVLTLGMAVDANVLIFERIREELRGGRAIKAAVDNGYNRAFVTILDSNVTTVLTAVVLLVFGSGPVKGFAVTLTHRPGGEHVHRGRRHAVDLRLCPHDAPRRETQHLAQAGRETEHVPDHPARHELPVHPAHEAGV